MPIHQGGGSGGSYSRHQFSWYKFAIFLPGYVAAGADERPLGTLRATLPLTPAAHNTAAAAERGSEPAGCVDVKMWR